MLTLDEAATLLEAARAEADSIGVPMSVAVMDPAGHLVAFTRMDGAPWVSADVDTLLGAVGASGGSGDQDEAVCAVACEKAGYRTAR
jgi:uncharacterized protein GlcG (DUF336 family)